MKSISCLNIGSLIEKKECNKFRNAVDSILPGFRVEMWDDEYGSLVWRITGICMGKEMHSMDYIGAFLRNSSDSDVYRKCFTRGIYRLIEMIYDYSAEKNGEGNVQKLR